jgi:molecular chaperone DnaJ
VACTRCNGYGTRSGKPPQRCPDCGGSGQKVAAQETRKEGEHTVHVQRVSACDRCAGRGSVTESPCADCGGRGQVDRPETLKVKVPPGIDDGMTLRVAGHGLPGTGDAPPGDLLVTVFSAPDPRFQRRGADLWRSETVDMVDAALGTRRTVHTLDGEAVVSVPAGTQPDTVLRLRGKGLPRMGGGERGDLNVRVQVHVPEALSEEARAALERLKDALRRQDGGSGEG